MPKISQYPDGGAKQDTDQFVIARGGVNYHILGSAIGGGGAGGIGGNLLLNANFNNWQQGTSFTAATTPANNDATYLADQWVLLSDGNDIVDVSQQSSSPPAGSRYFHRADVQTANKKFGFIQFIEAADAIPLRGQNVSLSIHAKTTAAAISNIRAAVMSWTGTADSVTRDVVSAWNASGSNITPVANWTLENTPANLALTASWQTFAIENIALDTAGLNNIAVFIWVDDTNAAVNDILDIGWVKLEIGATATDFIPPDYIYDLNRCKRFFYRWGYENADSGTGPRVFGNGGAGVFEGLTFLHPAEMRTIPTGTKAGTWGVTNCGQPALADISTKSFGIFTQVTASGSFDFFTNSPDDYVQFDARL